MVIKIKEIKVLKIEKNQIQCNYVQILEENNMLNDANNKLALENEEMHNNINELCQENEEYKNKNIAMKDLTPFI